MREQEIVMKNLFAQIMKFGMVGVVCFGIDYIIGYSVMKIMVFGAGIYSFRDHKLYFEFQVCL